MKTLRVLVIEDDALIAMLLSEPLVGRGHDVCATAATEAEAVAAASRHKPDLMIVDAGLGRGSGVSAVEKYSGGAARTRVHQRRCGKGAEAQAGRGGCPQTVPGS